MKNCIDKSKKKFLHALIKYFTHISEKNISSQQKELDYMSKSETYKKI